MRAAVNHTAELSVTSALVCSPPPVGIEHRRADTPAQRAALTGPAIVWATPEAFTNPDLFALAHATLQVARQMSEPSPDMRSVDVATGAMSLHPVTYDRVTIHADLPVREWAEVCAEGAQTVQQLQYELERVASLSDTPHDIAQECRLWADCCRPPTLADVPVSGTAYVVLCGR